MTIHGHAFAGPRGAATVVSAILLATATVSAILLATVTASALPHRSGAATVCGGTAKDIIGRFVNRFVNHQSGTPRQGSQSVTTVTFAAPNAVSVDRELIDSAGHPVMTTKGAGTFVVGPPLSWTEKGTYTSYNENQQSGQGTYQHLAFKASEDVCGSGTQVSNFVGRYTDPNGSPVGQPQMYTRQP